MNKTMPSGSGEATSYGAATPQIWRFWLSLVLTIPTFYWSPTWQATAGYNALDLGIASWFPTIFGVGAALIAGYGPVVAGFAEFKTKKPGRAAILGLAIVSAYVFAIVIQVLQSLGFDLKGQDFWWQASALASMASLGAWIEFKVSLRAKSQYPSLLWELPASVTVLADGVTQERPLEALQTDDVVIDAGWHLIPVDGQVVAGSVLVDDRHLTGASGTVQKSAGDFVFAGSIIIGAEKNPSELTIHDLLEQQNSAQNSTLQIRVGAATEECLLVRLVATQTNAATHPSHLESTAGATATWLFFIALAGSAVTALCWLTYGHAPLAFAIERAISVCAMASPLLFVLAVPSVSGVAIAQAAAKGIRVNHRKAFDALPSTKHLLIDKTGIITTGQRHFAEASITRRGGLEDQDELLAVAAGLQFGLEHSIAKAILAETYARGIIPIGVKDVMNIPGAGVSGRWEEHRLSIGGPVMLTRQKIDIDVQDLYRVDALNTDGKTVVFVARDSILLGYIAVSDEMNSATEDTVWGLQSLGFRVGMITGDAYGVASHFAKRLEIEEVYAEVLPADKASVIEALQAKGEGVALAGESTADEAALRQADVSIAFAHERNYASVDFDLVILDHGIAGLTELTELAARAQSKTRTNLYWAAGFNIVGLLLAAGILATIGTVFIPAVSAGLASVGVVITWLNARSLEGANK